MAKEAIERGGEPEYDVHAPAKAEDAYAEVDRLLDAVELTQLVAPPMRSSSCAPSPRCGADGAPPPNATLSACALPAHATPPGDDASLLAALAALWASDEERLERRRRSCAAAALRGGGAACAEAAASGTCGGAGTPPPPPLTAAELRLLDVLLEGAGACGGEDGDEPEAAPAAAASGAPEEGAAASAPPLGVSPWAGCAAPLRFVGRSKLRAKRHGPGATHCGAAPALSAAAAGGNGGSACGTECEGSHDGASGDEGGGCVGASADSCAVMWPDAAALACSAPHRCCSRHHHHRTACTNGAGGHARCVARARHAHRGGGACCTAPGPGAWHVREWLPAGMPPLAGRSGGGGGGFLGPFVMHPALQDEEDEHTASAGHAFECSASATGP